jgi:hypothetical protein
MPMHSRMARLLGSASSSASGRDHGTTVFISAGNRSRLVWRFLSAQSAQSALAKPICFMRLSSPLAIAYAIVGGPDKSVRPWGTA